MLRKLGMALTATLLLSAVVVRGVDAASQYSYRGISFLTAAPVPANTGFGTYFAFFNNTNVDSYGLPSNLVLGGWFSVYASNGAFMGPNGTRVAGTAEGGNAWANVFWFQWFYPWQPDDPSWRFSFNPFMPIATAGTIGGPTQFWIPLSDVYYSYHQARYIRDTSVFIPYFSLPVGGGFGFTPANGVVNQYNFTFLYEGWYQLQHMDELAFGNMGLGWLNTLELQPWFTYTHQLNTTPNLPASAVFPGACGTSGLPSCTFKGGYMPADSIQAGTFVSWGLKNINPELGPWRIGFMADGSVSPFNNVYAGHRILNSAPEAVSVGPGIQYAKGPFVLWFYYAPEVYTVNAYRLQQFFLELYYIFNL